MHFESYVVLDLETTDLRNAKITELSLIAINRVHCENVGVLPRVLNKLTLCFNPHQRVNPKAAKISGLNNEILLQSKVFNADAVKCLQLFLDRLPPPICLVAHNGSKFDFPLLKREIEHSLTDLKGEIYCVDSIPAFREILKPQTPAEDLMGSQDDIFCLQAMMDWEKSLSSEDENVPTPSDIASLDTRWLRGIPGVSPLSSLNESTPNAKEESQRSQSLLDAPKKIPRARVFSGNETACRRLNFNEEENVSVPPKVPKSFRLGDVYEYLYGQQPLDLHRAESDAMVLLMCILKVYPSFFMYADANHKLFDDVRYW